MKQVFEDEFIKTMQLWIDEEAAGLLGLFCVNSPYSWIGKIQIQEQYYY